MKTSSNGEREKKYGERIIALVLLAGGLLGLFGSTVGIYHFVQQHRAVAAVFGILSIAWFAWCIPTAAALWRRTPDGFKWAKLLFAMQIPVFTVARFSYEFSTLFSLRLMIGNTTHHIGANIGSSSNLNLLPQSAGFLFGINVFAVLIFLYLTHPSRVLNTIGRRVHLATSRQL